MKVVTTGKKYSFPEKGREELAYSAYVGLMRDFPNQTIPMIRYATYLLTNPENCKVLLPEWERQGFTQVLNGSGLPQNFPAGQKIRFWSIERRLQSRGITIYPATWRFNIPSGFDFRNAPDMTQLGPYLFEVVERLEHPLWEQTK